MRRPGKTRNAGLRLGVGMVIAAATIASTGCRTSLPAEPADRPARPLTILAGERFTEYDPAYAADDGSRALAHNIYQRLLSTRPGTNALRTDAAAECEYETPTRYVCVLRGWQSFSNQRPMTSADVKYSLERARDINAPGTSAWMLDSIQRIEAPTPDSVVLHLRFYDSNIGYALATAASSIVDRESFPESSPLPSSQAPVTNGPFAVDMYNPDEVVLRRQFQYNGANGAAPNTVIIRNVTDPVLKQRYVETRAVDIIWRAQSADQPPKVLDGTPYEPMVFPDTKVIQLVWNPKSVHYSEQAVRSFVRDATAPIRTADSVVPKTVREHHASFDTKGKVPAPLASATTLRLGYDASLADQQQVAERVKQALETAGGVTVALTTDRATADVSVAERYPDTNTSLAWLEPWLLNPVPGQEGRNKKLRDDYRQAPSANEAAKIAEQMQRLAAEDATVVPLSVGDQKIWVMKGIYLETRAKNHMGPNYQLSAWGWLWRR